MSTSRSHLFYGLLIALTSVVAGMVLASRLDLSPPSFARDINIPALNSAPIEGTLDATTFRNIAQQASPSVVSIVVTSRREAQELPDLFGFPNPFGGGGDAPPQLQQGAGSGFIIDDEGYILTNNHVIANAERIEVRLLGMENRRSGLAAEVVGRDELTDTALIRLTEMPDEPLVEASFGDSEQMLPGDWVMAIGNPFGFTHTVTVGIVSASGRDTTLAVSGRSEELLQTDAAINRGNSGGPLLNIRGEVIGMNTMIVSNNLNGGNVGIGFAVPINTISEILPELRTGKVTRGRIGIQILTDPITDAYAASMGLPRAGGAEVSLVAEGGPADAAGVQIGDVITEYNGVAVEDNEHLVNMVVRTQPGTTVPMTVYRDGEPVELSVTVEELDLETERGAVAAGPSDRNEREPIETGFGMTIEPVTPRIAEQLNVPDGRGGAVVSQVEQFSPASLVLQRGDVILRVGTTEVTTVDEVSAALDAVPSGGTARLIIWRQGVGETLVRVNKR